MIAGGDHQVDLESLMISEVVDLLAATLIELVFDDLRRDEPFEERSEKRRAAELALGTDVEQMAREPGVDEVQFRRFDQPFTEVLIERRDQQDLCGRFEDAQPLRDCGDRHAEWCREVRFVQHLSAATGDERQKPAERGQIANVTDRPDVPLEIGLDVRTKPERRGRRTCDHFREAASHDGDVGVLRR